MRPGARASHDLVGQHRPLTADGRQYYYARLHSTRQPVTPKDERGFTLVEMLLSIVLIGIIFSALAAAFTVAMNTLDSTSQKVTDSSGAQLLTSYLVADAQSSDHVQPTDFSCRAGRLLELRWTDADSTIGTVTDVVYQVVAQAGVNSSLIRYAYTVSTGNVCTLTQSTVIVREV